MPVFRSIISRNGHVTSFCLGCILVLSLNSSLRWFSIERENNAARRLSSSRKVAIMFGDSITQHGFDPLGGGYAALSLSLFFLSLV